MNVQMSRDQALAHYTKQKSQLESRLELTRASITILDQDWRKLHEESSHDAPASVELKMLSAIVKAQLLQLHFAENEGEQELKFIIEAMEKVASPLARAPIIPPTGVSR